MDIYWTHYVQSAETFSVRNFNTKSNKCFLTTFSRSFWQTVANRNIYHRSNDAEFYKWSEIEFDWIRAFTTFDSEKKKLQNCIQLISIDIKLEMFAGMARLRVRLMFVFIYIHMSAHTSAVHVCIGLSGQRHTHNVKWRTHVWRCSMLMLVWMSHDNSVPTCYMEILWWYATRVVRPIMIIHNVFFVIVLSANEVCICELFTSMTFFYDTLGP